ncbi:Peptidyl-prolyl cis-trans isomerase FPR2 [Echinococcus granulosus]|uniref:peptidylprolyl isomerase n=1 Tax=Echinococcus granulosus TaxID=6210 RepID=U6JI36_ECHGR|nr:FK506-binding protein 2 [Echinococcus granulosus]EUB61507.1 FK506-binding protein 2 [Echinococcus granulosus]KAH9280394.1 Peptidyl-prolyl cis-trans isomerase FPR2 [Echinococcus granulosus]CDS22983.1 FK506 binding protein 2 [Echinococcus granulosus]
MYRTVFNIVRLLLYVISVSGLNQSRKLTDLSIGIIRSASESECHLFVEKRDEVSVTFSGRLLKDNRTFASNVGEPPFSFKVGTDAIIPGWNKGILGMCLQEKRRIFVPSSMGYGAGGRPPDVPENADLVFDIELSHIIKSVNDEF